MIQASVSTLFDVAMDEAFTDEHMPSPYGVVDFDWQAKGRNRWVIWGEATSDEVQVFMSRYTAEAEWVEARGLVTQVKCGGIVVEESPHYMTMTLGLRWLKLTMMGKVYTAMIEAGLR